MGASAVIAVVAIGLLSADRGGDAAGSASPAVARPVPVEAYAAPETAGALVDGTGELSLAGLAGRPALVNFWGSWCSPCRREFPELKAFAEAHPEVSLVGVAVEEPAGDSLAFMRAQGATWPSISSEDGEIGRRWKLVGYPETFAVNAQGEVVARITGPTDAAQLAEAARLAGAS